MAAIAPAVGGRATGVGVIWVSIERRAFDRDQVRVEAAQRERGVDSRDHGGAGQGPVQQQRRDQGSGAGAVAEAFAGGVPEPFDGQA